MIGKRYRYSILATILILAFVFIYNISIRSEMIEAEDGIVDLSGVDFGVRQNYKLDGHWEFYWNQLINYEDLRNVKPDLYAEVPNLWTQYELDGDKLPGLGYATYRLHVKTDIDAGTQLGLKINTFSSAYKLYINDELVATAGRVASEASEEIGSYTPQTAFFQVPASDFDIIVQVSNYEYARGGFWYSIYMGSAENIRTLYTYSIGKELVLIGALLLASILYLTIFLLQSDIKSFLYFSCFCLLIAIMIDTIGENTLIGAIPGLSLKTAVFLWFTSTNLVPFFLVLFYNELFKSRFSKHTVRIYGILTVVFQLLFVFLPVVKYTKLAMLSDLHDALGYICAFVIIIIGINKGNKGGWLHFLSLVIVLACYLHDSLYLGNVINNSFGETFYAGLFFFVFLQMLVQTNLLKQFFDRHAATELKFLQAQIKPHFLYNAINTFVSLSYYDINKSRELMLSFGSYLRGSFDFKNKSQFVTIQNEIELSKFYVDIKKARFEDRLEIVFDFDCDGSEKVPNLVLEPVIENAINHGVLPKPEGGRVDISVKKEGKLLAFCVKDDGVGMDPERLHSILKAKGSSGVGLYNINKRLQKFYGKGLKISSSPDNGTEVKWNIPI